MRKGNSADEDGIQEIIVPGIEGRRRSRAREGAGTLFNSECITTDNGPRKQRHCADATDCVVADADVDRSDTHREVMMMGLPVISIAMMLVLMFIMAALEADFE